MYIISNKYQLLLCCVIISLSALSQGNTRPISIGLETGTLVYQGDLVPSMSGSFKNSKLLYGINVSKQFYPHFAIRASLLKGQVSADESVYQDPSWRQLRAFQFSTPITEFSTVIVFDFADQSLDQTKRLTPYLFAGIGCSFLKISRDWSRINLGVFDPKSSTILGLGIDTLKNTPKVLPVLPIGAGLRYAINERWSFNTELGFRLTMSDYIDGFSKAGNSSAKDVYYALKLGISYQFGNNGIKCPPAKR
ncbi:MAG: hypothetical protein B7Y15_14150 [Bacteroidetes bacterium 24-39-8]|jgi:hypothetical protein|nr:MAG: hypothetical protein B7Y15_14150 [Bacteroidetes bacterium 24-39-8]OZA62314.1 MAG: hypothetical protein B7X72_12380 [Sphingobacteriia bacterium 39-39-8]HQR94059.1 DUF6089 family protein [Sediminibacterium sp.]HQS56442.1 DUF6089 family protein [Sediminibacterium sp.]